MQSALLRCSFLLLLTLIHACSRLPESIFELAQDSRLPKWFTLPAGFSRNDARVTLTYYVGQSGWTAEAILADNERRTIAKAQGTVSDSTSLMSGRSEAEDRTGYPA